METIRSNVYKYIDQFGFIIDIDTPIVIGFNLGEDKIIQGPQITKTYPNQFGINDELYSHYILEYILDTTGVNIESLDNIDNFKVLDGSPFILKIRTKSKYKYYYRLAFGIIKGTLEFGKYDIINSLGNIEQIEGDLNFHDSAIQSLGSLKIVTGSLRFRGGRFLGMSSLCRLEKVGGDLILRGTSIMDLGSLKSVGGKLDLRQTNIKTLGELNFVGGDLLLPIGIRKSVDMSRIKVGGKTKFRSA